MHTVVSMAAMAEWLRRWTRNPMGSSRVGSNPTRSALFFFLFCCKRKERKRKKESRHIYYFFLRRIKPIFCIKITE